MKTLFFTLICAISFAFLVSGCGSGEEKSMMYSSSNCNDVKRDCLDQCRRSGKTSRQCLSECEKARGMCEAIKTKGCLQDCVLRFGKNTPATESCKKRCEGA